MVPAFQIHANIQWNQCKSLAASNGRGRRFGKENISHLILKLSAAQCSVVDLESVQTHRRSPQTSFRVSSKRLHR